MKKNTQTSQPKTQAQPENPNQSSPDQDPVCGAMLSTFWSPARKRKIPNRHT